MKKRMILGVTAIVLTGCLAACAVNSHREKRSGLPTVITVWNYYNGMQKETFDSLVQTFNDTVGVSENMIVESVSKGTIGELALALKESVEKKTGADPLPQICAAYADTAYEVNQKGLVADLSGYFTGQELEEYVDAYLEEGHLESEGGLKLFPIAKSTEFLTVNMTDWAKFAADTGAAQGSLQTWEGIAEVAEQYYKWSGGNAFFGRDAFANYMLVGSRQLGHELFSITDGKMVLDYDKETVRKLWDYYYVPYVNGYYTANGKFRSDDLKTGKLIALAGSSSGASYTPSSVTFEDGTNYEITCEIFPLPNFAGRMPEAVQQGAGMIVLKSDEKTEAAAVTFLKWFTDVDQNLEFCLKTGYLPVKKSANTREALNRMIENKKIEVSDIMRQSFYVGIQVVNEYQLCTAKAFAGAGEARTLLENEMTKRAIADKEEIDARIAAGMKRETAVAQFVTDENFEQWYIESYQNLAVLGE